MLQRILLSPQSFDVGIDHAAVCEKEGRSAGLVLCSGSDRTDDSKNMHSHHAVLCFQL